MFRRSEAANSPFGPFVAPFEPVTAAAWPRLRARFVVATEGSDEASVS